MSELRVIPVAGLPEIGAGDAIGALIAAAAAIEPGDVVTVSQKVVSKAEGRTRELSRVEPDARAREIAARVGKDPALVQLVLEESVAVIRAEPGVLVTETRGGWICANAGIDNSNVPGDGRVTLLPSDADESARRIRAEILADSGVTAGVVIADSFGRPWRLGQFDVAIGCAGIEPLRDERGGRDRDGRELTATLVAVADEIAAAADLVRRKADGVPAVVVRGLGHLVGEDDGPGGAAIRRPAADDLFR